MISFPFYSLFLTFNSLSISPSAYFTYGDLSEGTKSYSLATYWTLEHKKNYLLFAYDNFRDQWVRQNLVSVGYAKELLHLLGIRGIGFYIFDSIHNVSRILSIRILYGYSPIWTLGYAVSSYSKQWSGERKFYTVYQITPECRIFMFKSRHEFNSCLQVSPCYINALGEKYISLSGNLSLGIGAKFSIEFGGMLGERFYYIDDKLLIVNNRPNIEKGRMGVKLNYRATNNLRLVLDLERDSFRSYNINYYVLGLKIEL